MNIMEGLGLRKRLGELEFRRLELMRDVNQLTKDADAADDKWTRDRAIKLFENIAGKNLPTEGGGTD